MPTSDAPGPLPRFIIAGANACGTTYLANLLANHPDVFMPPAEGHYFDRLRRPDQVDLAEYLRTFAGAPAGATAIGEKTPSYLYFPWVAGMLAEAIPDVRLIFLLRDPVRRAYAHYWRMVRLGREPLSFERALAAEPHRLQGSHADRIAYSYQARGRYMHQLERYAERFSRDQMLFLLSEEMFARPEETFARATEFIGVPERPEVEITREPANHIALPRRIRTYRALAGLALATYRHRPVLPIARAARSLRQKMQTEPRPYPPMKAGTQESLADRFRDDTAALSAYLGRPLDAWSTFG